MAPFVDKLSAMVYTSGCTAGCTPCFTGGYNMRKPRTLVAIPRQLAIAIDKIAGEKQRTSFIVDLLHREVRRREQREALREAAGSWKDEDHPELAGGADAWVREMRQESVKRLEKIQQRREAE
jgi:hypothetical protein